MKLSSSIVKLIFFSLTFLSVLSCSKTNRIQKHDSGPLEISSWWTAEGENNALEILQDQFISVHPDFSIINSYMAGGSGTNARLVLSGRLSEGTPPDVFQSLIGRGLTESSVKMGQVESLTFLYKRMEWDKVFHPVVLDALTYKGDYYAVPLNIHRANLIWYRPDVFQKLGISLPASMDELMNVCEVLAENGITPFALGDKLSWTALHLFENILLSVAGEEKYRGFWTGQITFWDEDVRKSLLYFLRSIEYSNSDHSALSWDEALWNVVQGNCGMTVVGDWADSNLILKGLDRNIDYSWAVFPGTEGVYNWLADGFCLPKGAVRRDEALEWLKLIGSKEGQERFNFYKSSLPVRMDVESSTFSAYQLSAYHDFQNSTLVGSVSNGVLVSDKIWTVLLEIISDYTLNHDTENTQRQLEEMRKLFMAD